MDFVMVFGFDLCIQVDDRGASAHGSASSVNTDETFLDLER
jgi:hypothetical protein